MSDCYGYIVLTRHPDAPWCDDWDATVHPTIEAGCVSRDEAAEVCGVDNVVLVSLHPVVDPPACRG